VAVKKIIFQITPQTHVRATQGDSIYFRIPKDKLRPAGLKRRLRLERYNEYKLAIAALAKERHFVMPAFGCFFKFFIPCPKSWSGVKRKRHHFTFHQARPDLDNLLKAVMDGLMREDKEIAHLQVAKYWVDFPEGWIEIEIDDMVTDARE